MQKAFYSFDDFKKSGCYSKWWRKYLSKCKLIKRSCSWRETYCVMNTEQKSKNIFKYCILNNEDQLNTSHGRLGWKYFKKKKIPCKVEIGRNFFAKRKKFSWKYKNSITFTNLQIAPSIRFLDFYKDKNTKLHSFFFFAVPTIVETAMEALPLLIRFFSIRAHLILS